MDTAEPPLFSPSLRERFRASGWAYPAYARIRLRDVHGRRKDVRRNTDLVIEGFPRSGNTFAYALVYLASGGVLQIAHHLHAVGHCVKAVRLGVPVVVVIREPTASVASYLVRRPSRSASDVLDEYIAFHQGVLKLASSVHVVSFSDLTSDSKQFLRLVQTLVPDPRSLHWDASLPTRAMALAEDLNRLNPTTAGRHQQTVAVPNPARNTQTNEIMARLQADHAPQLAIAKDVFERLLERKSRP